MNTLLLSNTRYQKICKNINYIVRKRYFFKKYNINHVFSNTRFAPFSVGTLCEIALIDNDYLDI